MFVEFGKNTFWQCVECKYFARNLSVIVIGGALDINIQYLTTNAALAKWGFLLWVKVMEKCQSENGWVGKVRVDPQLWFNDIHYHVCTVKYKGSMNGMLLLSFWGTPKNPLLSHLCTTPNQRRNKSIGHLSMKYIGFGRDWRECN